MAGNRKVGRFYTDGNMSPELSWTHAAPWTKSYAVVTFDVTANFTHWGVYNIPPEKEESRRNSSKIKFNCS